MEEKISLVATKMFLIVALKEKEKGKKKKSWESNDSTIKQPKQGGLNFKEISLMLLIHLRASSY